jgi:hypothetical protein
MIREKKLPKHIDDQLKEVLPAIRRYDDVVALYLLGSFAKKNVKPLSDIDFGVLLAKKLDREERFKIHLDLIGWFADILKTDEIDLILMNDAPLKFAHEIFKTGKLLYCGDENELIDFYEKTVKFYLDFRFFRDQFDSAFLEGIGYHG